MRQNSKNILHLPIVDSTNNYAMALIEKKQAADELTVVTDEQSGGKGRHGNQWLSTKCENVMLSLILNMNWLPLKRQFELSAAISLAVCEFLQRKTSEKVFIKWPNDIFINDSKAGGILIENIIKGKIWQWSVIGMGLNINQEHFDESSFTATSLKKETGKDFEVIKLAEELYESVLKRIEGLKSGNFNKMLEEYNQHLYARDKWVKLRKGNQVFETKIISVSLSGELVTKDAKERRFLFDEVEFKGLVRK